GGAAAEPVAGVRRDHRNVGVAGRTAGLRAAGRRAVPDPCTGERDPGVVGWHRALRGSRAVFEVFGGTDDRGGWPLPADQPRASAALGHAEAVDLGGHRTAGVFAGADLERAAWLGVG